MRCAKECLSRCSEPTDDKQALDEKNHQLKILHREVPQGQRMLEGCNDESEDREHIENKVTLLKEKYLYGFRGGKYQENINILTH